eukprot:PhM_4_TR5192/c1_g2_i2/m.46765/K02335/DPO1, polA; DNA polymerase I
MTDPLHRFARSVILVDVNGVMWRTFHVAKSREASSRMLVAQEAAQKFFSGLLRALMSDIPEFVFPNKTASEASPPVFGVHRPILCFDQHGGQRRLMHPELYKQQRPSSRNANEMISAIEMIRDVAYLLGIHSLPKDKKLPVEADDLIDTAVRVLHEQDPEGYRIVMSVDKDLLACLRHGDGYNTCVLRPHKNVWVSNKNAEKELGVPPHRVSEFLAMNGDASDGIPPIPAISGARRAANMLSVYPDLYELANSQFLRGNALRTLIMNYSLTVPHNVPDVVARLDSSPNVYDSINFLRVKRISEALRKRFGSHSWNTSERKLCRLLESRTARAQGRCKKVLETKENRDPTADPTSSHAIVEDV